MAPEIIDDAYCDSCTLNLTINYYESEDQRLSRSNVERSDDIASVVAPADKPTARLAVESVTSAGLLSSVTLDETMKASKPSSAKKRRARDARALLRKLEDVKKSGNVGETVGGGKAKARELGMQDVKWVKGQGPSSRMSMIARVRTMPGISIEPVLTCETFACCSATPYPDTSSQPVRLHSIRPDNQEDHPDHFSPSTRYVWLYDVRHGDNGCETADLIEERTRRSVSPRCKPDLPP